MKTVLIIENDLGWVFWLGQALDEIGYQALPAKDVADAISLLRELKSNIDVLIVNPTLKGVVPFIERLRRSHGLPRVPPGAG